MALTLPQIVDAAYEALCRHGLAGLTMRRLAQDLGVQPGALYYHIASKQDLLVAVAEHIFSDSVQTISTTDPAQAAWDIRQALLAVPDSAEVVSFVQAFRPDTLAPFREMQRLFEKQLPDRRGRWAAQTVIHYVLGFVAEEHNQAELVRARIPSDAAAGQAERSEAFTFGVDVILRGIDALGDDRP